MNIVTSSLKSAAGVAVGVAVGGCVLPRLFFSGLYGSSFPPLWQQALLYLAVGYAAAFVTFLLINFIKAKLQKHD